MATYVCLVNYTQQGIQNVKDSPNRLDAAKKLLKDMGGEIKGFYLTLGQHDIVTVVEAPDEQTVAKFVLSWAARGNLRTTTLAAFPEAEYRKIIQSLP